MINFKDHDAVYLSCGDFSRTDILTESVDLVITDPPFFDNVHYSELADFFYIWLRKIIGAEGVFAAENTRSEEEVQNVNSIRLPQNWLRFSPNVHVCLREMVY